MRKKSSYDDIYKKNIELMQGVLKVGATNKDAWDLFYKHYIDPDRYPINGDHKKYKNIICTADGLLSVKRIFEHEGFGERFIDTYSKYRKTPIIFFPSERNGINMSRYRIFGDRIDHTLFDLKNRMSEPSKIGSCKLLNAYNKPKTKIWLCEEIESFEKFVGWLGIKGIFTNEDNEIYDLETNDGKTTINDYSKEYSMNWSEQYYTNIKKKIEEFENSIIKKSQSYDDSLVG